MTAQPSPLTPQQQLELASLAIDLANNPATRATVVPLIEKVRPNTYRFHDVEATKNAEEAARKAAKAEIEAQEAERLKAQRLADMNSQRAKLISDGRFTEETIKNLETFMQGKGIGNYADAAVLYAHENPPATPRPEIANASTFDMPNLTDWKNPRKTALEAAYKIADEFARKRA